MSPIHDQSYRRYQGTRRPSGGAWLVILKAGLRSVLTRKALVGLLVLSWLPFLVRTVQIYLTVTYPEASRLLPVNPQMFQRFLEYQGFFAFLLTVFVGAGLVANDRRANALQIYLSKPLVRAEYVAGKLAILVTCLLAVTLLPALLLVVMQIAFSGGLDFVRANAFILPAIFASAIVRVCVASVTVLALSALSKSARYVAVMYAGTLFLTEALYGVLTFVTGSTRVAWVSIGANLAVVSDALFRQTPRYDTPVVVSILALGALVVVSLSILERQVRGVEVVS